mgnify:CR=1 FL=1
MASVPPKVDRTARRQYLVVNLLVLPGLGTFLAGRRRLGILQAMLALTGFGLTGVWFATFGAAWWQTREFPLDGGPHFAWGITGVALFLAAWCWSLATGWKWLRDGGAR